MKNWFLTGVLALACCLSAHAQFPQALLNVYFEGCNAQPRYVEFIQRRDLAVSFAESKCSNSRKAAYLIAASDDILTTYTLVKSFPLHDSTEVAAVLVTDRNGKKKTEKVFEFASRNDGYVLNLENGDTANIYIYSAWLSKCLDCQGSK